MELFFKNCIYQSYFQLHFYSQCLSWSSSFTLDAFLTYTLKN